MTSFRQFEANRRNALRSTGPKTEEGKRHSRVNAVRHGLTAETVIGSLEDAGDYNAFEAAIIADYCAETAVARELVLRLASLLWRLRRATAIETDLFELQAGILKRNDGAQLRKNASNGIHPFRSVRGLSQVSDAAFSSDRMVETECQVAVASNVDPDLGHTIRQLTNSFSRLAERDISILERLNRYEKGLWRQALQIILILRSTKRSRITYDLHL
jgi:hypothetical protein